MAALISAMAALATAGTGIYAATQGGKGGQQKIDYSEAQLADARNNVINAQINAAQTGKLGRAGYTDPSGGGFHYDPVTNSWVSSLGESAKGAQDAFDQGSISRNTDDLRQSQRSNARAESNSASMQPLIDAARRRVEGYQPMSGDELTSLLSETAAKANTDAYRPIVQDTLRNATRTGSDAGSALADIGKRSSMDLRQGMVDARLKGITGADSINQSRKQGLNSDLQSAMTAGTPQFQNPTLQPRTDNKDLLAAMTNRAGTSAYAAALGQRGVNEANEGARSATKDLVGQIPYTDPSVSGLVSGVGQAANFLKGDEFKGLINGWFGDDKKPAWDPAGGLNNTPGVSLDPRFAGQTFNSGGVF